MESKASTSDEAHFKPSGSWLTGEDAPDFGDMEEQDLEFMQDQEAERMEDTVEPPSPPMPECDVMEDAPVQSEELRREEPMSIDVNNPALDTYEMVKARFELKKNQSQEAI